MNQLKLSYFEKKRLSELQEYNYCNSGIICDIVLADKLKEIENGYSD
jgi:hypothetical protein